MSYWSVIGAFGRWSVGRWSVGQGSMVDWSVGRWSVVGGRLVGGFKETSYSYIFSFILQYYLYRNRDNINTQPAITCSKSTIETLEQGLKYVQS